MAVLIFLLILKRTKLFVKIYNLMFFFSTKPNASLLYKTSSYN